MEILSDVVLPANPDQAMEAATKQYVDSAVGAGGGVSEVTVGGTAPTVAGGVPELWVDEAVSPVVMTFPIASIIDYGGPSAPSGWLLCDGREYLRSTYALLDAVIGTTYGSYTNGAGAAGTTHLRTPDLRGRVGVGMDNMGGGDMGRLSVPNTLGGGGGAETHTLVTGEIPAHTHIVCAPGDHTWGVSYGGVSGAFTFIFQPYAVNGGTYAGSPLTAQATGGGTPHNNMPPYLLINKIIYAGV